MEKHELISALMTLGAFVGKTIKTPSGDGVLLGTLPMHGSAGRSADTVVQRSINKKISSGIPKDVSYYDINSSELLACDFSSIYIELKRDELDNAMERLASGAQIAIQSGIIRFPDEVEANQPEEEFEISFTDEKNATEDQAAGDELSFDELDFEE